MTRSTPRLLLGIALPFAAAVIGYGPYLLWRSDLPDRLATHFDGSGTPDDSMTQGVFLLFTSAFMVAGIAVLIGLALRSKPLVQGVGAIAGFLGGFFAGLGAAILGATVVAQRDIESWTEADGPWMLVVAIIILGLTMGAIGARLGSMLPVSEPVAFDTTTQPVMDLSDTENAVWSTRMRSSPLFMVGAAVLVLGIVIALGTMWWIMIPTLVSGFAALALATLHVRADAQGLHVKYGLLPWPRTNVRVDQIEQATVIDVRPMQWGGWGYRGSLKLMKQAAVVHRAGPGVRLDLKDGKVFVVTVDNPETPVALLNAEVARQTRETVS